MMADSGPLSKRPRLEKGGGGGGGGGAIAGAKGGDAGVALEVLSVSSTLFSFYM